MRNYADLTGWYSLGPQPQQITPFLTSIILHISFSASSSYFLLVIQLNYLNFRRLWVELLTIVLHNSSLVTLNMMLAFALTNSTFKYGCTLTPEDMGATARSPFLNVCDHVATGLKDCMVTVAVCTSLHPLSCMVIFIPGPLFSGGAVQVILLQWLVTGHRVPSSKQTGGHVPSLTFGFVLSGWHDFVTFRCSSWLSLWSSLCTTSTASAILLTAKVILAEKRTSNLFSSWASNSHTNYL